jgi:hypothetical protein
MNGHDRAELDARLDDAFGTLPDTDELRDLRDEVRASLAARIEELQSGGAGPTAAVATAFAELGDIRSLAAEVSGTTATGPARGTAVDPEWSAGRTAAELVRGHRVRPRPAFVVRTVLLSATAAGGLTLTILDVLDIIAWPIAVSVIAVVLLLAAPIGVIIGDALHQETTTNFPLPAGRAAGYGTSAFLGLAGLALAALYAADHEQVWLIAVGAPLVVISIAWFSYLGATQTNRKKPWLRRLHREHPAVDRFSQDEAAAARFGIYTVVIGVLAISAFVVLSLTVGLAWSWLALVAGAVAFFLVLARMLFPPGRAQPSRYPDRADDRHSNGAHHD